MGGSLDLRSVQTVQGYGGVHAHTAQPPEVEMTPWLPQRLPPRTVQRQQATVYFPFKSLDLEPLSC